MKMTNRLLRSQVRELSTSGLACALLRFFACDCFFSNENRYELLYETSKIHLFFPLPRLYVQLCSHFPIKMIKPRRCRYNFCCYSSHNSCTPSYRQTLPRYRERLAVVFIQHTSTGSEFRQIHIPATYGSSLSEEAFCHVEARRNRACRRRVLPGCLSSCLGTVTGRRPFFNFALINSPSVNHSLHGVYHFATPQTLVM